MHFKTVHQNNSWMSTVNKNGFGDMITEDFVKLMENHGFRVDDAKTVPLKYKFETDFIRNYFKSVVMTSFPELQGDTRKKFFNEFIPRVKDLTQLVCHSVCLSFTFLSNFLKDSDGYYDSNVDGIQIFGEKIKTL